MATQRFGLSLSNSALAGTVAIGLLAASAAYAINPVFADRFSYCMKYWNVQERADATVFPRGIEKTDFCKQWSREDLPSIPFGSTELPFNAIALNEKESESETENANN
jgi:hypothetical protein